MSSKFQQQLSDLKIDKIIYHYDHPLTVCSLIKDGEILARGVALCSYRDQFVKSTGRIKALGRAVKAAYTKKNSEFIRDENDDKDESMTELFKIFINKGYYTSKAMYKPNPNAHEEKVIESLRKAKQSKTIHNSDCATYNEPAMPKGKCDCSMCEM